MAMARWCTLGLLSGCGALLLYGSTRPSWLAVVCWVYLAELARCRMLGLLVLAGPLIRFGSTPRHWHSAGHQWVCYWSLARGLLLYHVTLLTATLRAGQL